MITVRKKGKHGGDGRFRVEDGRHKELSIMRIRADIQIIEQLEAFEQIERSAFNRIFFG